MNQRWIVSAPCGGYSYEEEKKRVDVINIIVQLLILFILDTINGYGGDYLYNNYNYWWWTTTMM